MALWCANVNCDEEAVVVCHHCGKPLCKTHKINVKKDEAFSSIITAFHCDECELKHHPDEIVHGFWRLIKKCWAKIKAKVMG